MLPSSVLQQSRRIGTSAIIVAVGAVLPLSVFQQLRRNGISVVECYDTYLYL